MVDWRFRFHDSRYPLRMSMFSKFSESEDISRRHEQRDPLEVLYLPMRRPMDAKVVPIHKIGLETALRFGAHLRQVGRYIHMRWICTNMKMPFGTNTQ